MPVTTIFLGSSSAAKSQAKLVIKSLSSETVTFLPWWEAFLPGTTTLEQINKIPSKVDAALFVFSPETETVIRKRNKWIPNLNVLFEFGHFYGCLGKGKVVMLKFGKFYLPSDLKGYTYITGSKQFKHGKSVALAKQTKHIFDKWIYEFETRNL